MSANPETDQSHGKAVAEPTAKAEVQYVLLCRHFKRAPSQGRSQKELAEIHSVVDVLKETIARQGTSRGDGGVRLAAVWVARTPEAQWTFDRIRRALPSDIGVTEQSWLTPQEASQAADGGCSKLGSSLQDLATAVQEQERSGGDANPTERANAVLVIGHMPQLGWFADEVLKRPYAIAHGEIVCISQAQRHWQSPWRTEGSMLWAISPEDEATRNALVEKIKSKMDMAKLFSIVIAFALGVILDRSKLVEATGGDMVLGDVAALLFLSGFALYLATLYAYDRLLMPSRFWTQRRKRGRRAGHWLSSRPPSSSNVVLYQNMMRTWNWLFTPATLLIGAGLVVLAIAAVDPTWLACVIAAVTSVGLVAWVAIFRPVLGTED